MTKEVVIVSAVRTPIGSFSGGLSSISAPRLGAIAIKGALDHIKLDYKLVDEVFMGNVLQAGLGQAPARQAAIYAGLGDSIPCTTVNKVCSSGLKSVMIAAQAIKAGDAEVVVAGGMENMSQAPHYLKNSRKGQKLGDMKLTDGMVHDGLMDVYSDQHMGNCAEVCATDKNYSREQQDEHAMESYKRSAKAWEEGRFSNEVIPVEVPQRKGNTVIVREDEEYKNVRFDKIPGLRPVFKKDGSVTAANASTINDGAAAVVVMSRDRANELGLKPLAVIKSYADAAQDPVWFTTAPSLSIPKALDKAELKKDDIDFYEINEAFSVVSLANMDELGLSPDKVNVNGGAVSLGHPIGCSGSRILVTLINVLEQNNGKYGVASLCNGGGGASSMVIERL